MNSYRKPNGEYTSDGDEYVEAWESMIQPILDATGLVLYGFDPDFGLRVPDTRYSINLPIWFVERLNRGLAGLPQEEPKPRMSLDEWLEDAENMLEKWREDIGWEKEQF